MFSSFCIHKLDFHLSYISPNIIPVALASNNIRFYSCFFFFKYYLRALGDVLTDVLHSSNSPDSVMSTCYEHLENWNNSTNDDVNRNHTRFIMLMILCRHPNVIGG